MSHDSIELLVGATAIMLFAVALIIFQNVWSRRRIAAGLND
jgi:hypothetical protein